MAQAKIEDLIIIGGSAAAVSAAIYAARRALKFKIISLDFGGEVAKSGIIDNYPGIAHTDGIELTDKFKEHLKSYNIDCELEVWVEKVRKKGKIFEVLAKKRNQKLKYYAKTVLVATGVHPRRLEVVGDKEYYAKGVSYCTVCDGPLFKGKTTITIGGGNSGLESSIMMSQIAKKHYLLTIKEDLKGDAVLIEKVKKLKNVQIIYNASTTKILGNGFATGIEYKDLKTGKINRLKAEGIFIHIGMVPNSLMVDNIKKNKFGEILVDYMCRTSVPGLFAAGDVTNVPYKQIAISSGQGVCSALAAVDYLNKLK